MTDRGAVIGKVTDLTRNILTYGSKVTSSTLHADLVDVLTF